MTSASDSTPAQASVRAPQAHGLPRSLVAHPRYGPLPGLLLILTVVTGVVDSISILALGRVFVANMTGNVVFAGFAIVGAPGFSLSASLFALAGFLIGATAGGGMITRVGGDRAALLRAATAAEAALAAVALVLAALSGDPGVTHGTIHVATGAFGPAITDALAAVLAIAMGKRPPRACPLLAGISLPAKTQTRFGDPRGAAHPASCCYRCARRRSSRASVT